MKRTGKALGFCKVLSGGGHRVIYTGGISVCTGLFTVLTDLVVDKERIQAHKQHSTVLINSLLCQTPQKEIICGYGDHISHISQDSSDFTYSVLSSL